MPRLHQWIGCRGEHGAGVHFAAIGTKPALPETSQPKHPAMDWLKTMALLKKGRCRNQATAMAPSPTKTGLLHHRFRAGIDRPWALGWIFHPRRQQPPEQQRRLHLPLVLHEGKDGLRWRNQRSRAVDPPVLVGQHTQQRQRQLIRRALQGKASTHQAQTSPAQRIAHATCMRRTERNNKSQLW